MSLLKRVHQKMAGKLVGGLDRDGRRDVMRAALEAMANSSERLGGKKAHNLYFIEVGRDWSRDLPTNEDIKRMLVDNAEKSELDFDGSLDVHLLRVEGDVAPSVESFVGVSRRTSPRMEAVLATIGEPDDAPRLEIPANTVIGSVAQGSAKCLLAFPENGEPWALVPNPLGDVSRKHARITMTGPEEFNIEDLSSTNGTRVNRKRIDAETPHPLSFGDNIEVGSISFIFDRLLPISAKLISEQGIPDEFEIAISNNRDWRIGRDHECEVQIGEYAGDVSNHHAAVAYGPGGYWLRDLGSKNGTHVMRESEKIGISGDGEELLRHQDRIVLGREVTVVYLEE